MEELACWYIPLPHLASVNILGINILGYPSNCRLCAVDADIPVEQRAKSYLHSNYSFCHRSGGVNDMDLRFQTPLTQMVYVMCHATFEPRQSMQRQPESL